MDLQQAVHERVDLQDFSSLRIQLSEQLTRSAGKARELGIRLEEIGVDGELLAEHRCEARVLRFFQENRLVQTHLTGRKRQGLHAVW
jgi:hypothetical protein